MSRMIIETSNFEGIPYNEYSSDNMDIKGLVFIQHGFESNKNRGADYLAIQLARKGYKVVSIDAYKHGDRLEEPFISEEVFKRYADAFIIVDQTTKDIITIFENIYKKEFSNFDLIGVSMGGFIAYVVSMQCDYVNKLLPVITTPYFEELARKRTNVPNLENYKLEMQSSMELIISLDPSKQVDNMKYKSMFILSCKNDEVISYLPSKRFYDEFKNDKMMIKFYEDGHTVNRQMQNDIVEYIVNEKVV